MQFVGILQEFSYLQLNKSKNTFNGSIITSDYGLSIIFSNLKP